MSATPSAQYRLTIRVKLDDSTGCSGASPARSARPAGWSARSTWSRSTATHSAARHRRRRLRRGALGADPRRDRGASTAREVIDTTDRTFLLHVGGKIEQHNKHPLKTRDDLSMAYTPGVARVCLAIADDPDKAFQYTIKRNTVAVVSDGTAVLGLGDIGPRGGDAGDGGQVLPVQGVRRRRRVPDLPGHEGPRRDRRAPSS